MLLIALFCSLLLRTSSGSLYPVISPAESEFSLVVGFEFLFCCLSLVSFWLLVKILANDVRLITIIVIISRIKVVTYLFDAGSLFNSVDKDDNKNDDILLVKTCRTTNRVHTNNLTLFLE